MLKEIKKESDVITNTEIWKSNPRGAVKVY